MKTEILAIGDEILIGQIVDTNSPWIASQLLKENINVSEITIVSDNREKMLSAIDKAFNRSDVILITGGLGPTKDDLTKDILAEYFKSGWRWDEQTLKMLENRYAERGRVFNELNKKQAYLPDNCITLLNYWGSAPGMLFKRKGKILISMPGVPYEMKNIFEKYVIAEIKKMFNPPPILVHHFFTLNIPESILAEKIKDIEEGFHPNFKLAYLPHINIVRLRLTCEIKEKANDEQLFQEIIKKIRSRLSDSVLFERDIDIEQYLFEQLSKNKKTLSIAESCTGGYISHKLTLMPGVSSVFKGAAVTYSNESKQNLLGVKSETLENFGAVSEQTAKEMAEGCLRVFNSDFAISTTGIAGPDGGTEQKPVGTVFIAVADKNGTTVKRLSYKAKRERIIEHSFICILEMLIERVGE